MSGGSSRHGEPSDFLAAILLPPYVGEAATGSAQAADLFSLKFLHHPVEGTMRPP